MFFYSPSKRGFFHKEINPVIPDDAVAITDAEHKHLLEQNGLGKDIVFQDGKPVAVDRVITLTWDNIRNTRNGLLSKSDYTQMSDYPGDKEAWAVYRQQLRDITETFADPNDVVWPDKP